MSKAAFAAAFCLCLALSFQESTADFLARKEHEWRHEPDAIDGDEWDRFGKDVFRSELNLRESQHRRMEHAHRHHHGHHHHGDGGLYERARARHHHGHHHDHHHHHKHGHRESLSLDEVPGQPPTRQAAVDDENKECSGFGGVTSGTVVLGDDNSLKFVAGKEDPQGLAWGRYEDRICTTGWSTLYLNTNPRHEDMLQVRAAGFLEGALTFKRIDSHFANVNVKRSAASMEGFKLYSKHHDKWLREEARKNPDDGYWVNVLYTLEHVHGLHEGYSSAGTESKYDAFDFMVFNGFGDFEHFPELLSRRLKVLDGFADDGHDANTSRGMAASPDGLSAYDRELKKMLKYHAKKHPMMALELEEEARVSAGEGHCSSVVRLADSGELFASHATWTHYNQMTRVSKFVDMPLQHPSVKAHKFSFASYPGLISANYDDFILMDTGLQLAGGTDFNVSKKSVWDTIQPTDSVLAWIRLVVANRMATTSPEWTDLYARYPSGTDNQEITVVDHKLLERSGKHLLPNTVWIVEEVPRLTKRQDVSGIINAKGYWGNFNKPYAPHLREHIAWKDCHSDMRFSMAQELMSGVQSMDDMKTFMRYNGHSRNDPACKGSENAPTCGIASRFDLLYQHGSQDYNYAEGAFGAVDAKITSNSLFNTRSGEFSGRFWAVCGPTVDEGHMPVFSWAPGTVWNDIPHRGLPDAWNFPFALMDPKAAVSENATPRLSDLLEEEGPRGVFTQEEE